MEKAYKLIHNFLNKHFQEIESVVLFGSYIDNPSKANDIDLLLMSHKFLYSSKESFLFEGIKINVIKFNISEVFSILAKHYQQGDFYKLVFSKGIVIVDKNKDVQFVKEYINSSYPKTDSNSIALALNETLFKLTELIDALDKPLSQIEYFAITAKIISHLMEWFLFSNSFYILKYEKYKTRFFNKNLPNESAELLKLIHTIQKNNQKKFLQELHLLINEYNIPVNKKYSNDLIFDDYSQSSLILYVENLFNFNEIKQIIDTIKSENKELQFYIYQVDEDNQEKKGCYIVLDNNNLEFENNKQKWISFLQSLFSNQQYTFPYNNIFCYPEIKFIGKHNLQLVTQLLTKFTNAMHENKASKESFLLYFFTFYLSEAKVSIEVLYNFYLGKLTSKNHTSNYSDQKNNQTETKFLSANLANEKKLLPILKKTERIDLQLEFKICNNLPFWFHIQVIDRVFSVLLKNDFEKLFYIHCSKKIFNE